LFPVSAAFAAATFAALTLVVIAFQLALAAGMPWGALTWGGRYPGRLPPPMRGVAIASAALLAAFAAVVGARAGWVFPAWYAAARWLVWIVVVYCALGVVANTITPSRRERRLWLPIVAVLLICSLIVATS
jgi:hypothetical protein